MTTQTWNSEGYDKNARFVTDLGAPVLELLAPKPGEHTCLKCCRRFFPTAGLKRARRPTT
jgi:hypothetical protein